MNNSINNKQKEIILTKLIVKDFINIHKTFNEINIDEELKPITILIGENGTGKTLLIQAIYSILYGISFDSAEYKKIQICYNGSNKPINHTKQKYIKNPYKLLDDICTKSDFEFDLVYKLIYSGTFSIPWSRKHILDKFLDKLFETYKKILPDAKIENMSYPETIYDDINGLLNNNQKHSVVSIMGNNNENNTKITKRIKNIILDSENINSNHFAKNSLNKLRKEKEFNEVITNKEREFSSLFEYMREVSNRLHSSLNRWFCPLKKNDYMINNTEFIFIERNIASFFKNEIGSQNFKISKNDIVIGGKSIYFNHNHPFILHELRKENFFEILKNFNDEINQLIDQICKLIIDDLHKIEIYDKNKDNNSQVQKNQVQEAIKYLTSSVELDSIKFIKNLSNSKDKTISKSIFEYIKENKTIVEKLTSLKEKLEKFQYAIEQINSFLKDTLNAELKINGENLIISSDKINKKLKDYKFSSGQKSLIKLISNIILLDKKLYIIDEPEISFSLIWVKNFWKFIKKASSTYKKQFIISTHSYSIMDKLSDDISTIEFSDGFLENCKQLYKGDLLKKAIASINQLPKGVMILLVEGNGDLDEQIYSDAIHQISKENIKSLPINIFASNSANRIISIGSKKNVETIKNKFMNNYKISSFSDKDNDKWSPGLTRLYSIESYFVLVWKKLIPKDKYNEFKFLANKIKEMKFKKYEKFVKKIKKELEIKKDNDYDNSKKYTFQINNTNYKNNVALLIRYYNNNLPLIEIYKNNEKIILKNIIPDLKKINFS